MQKERHIGSDTASDVIERRVGAVDIPQFGQGNDDRGGIRRGTSQAGAQRDTLFDRHAHVGIAAVMLGHSDCRPISRILLHGKIGCRNRLDGQRLRRRDRHGIDKTDGCHQGIDPVIAAGVALGMNSQIEVNLCRRGKDEGPIGHR